jgi:hypothetical protein
MTARYGPVPGYVVASGSKSLNAAVTLDFLLFRGEQRDFLPILPLI